MNTTQKRIAALEANLPQPQHDDRAFTSLLALRAGMIRDAVPSPVNYLKPSIEKLAGALLARMTSDKLTDQDMKMLAGVPECEYPIDLLLEMTAYPPAHWRERASSTIVHHAVRQSTKQDHDSY